HFAGDERALVIHPHSTELARIPVKLPPEPTMAIEEDFDLKAGRAPAALRVTTRYQGAHADQMRAKLQITSPAELSRQYLNFYAQDDAKIQATALPKIADDAVGNVVTVTEQYAIPNFWTGDRRHFDAHAIGNALNRPHVRRRSMPLAITHPVYIT